MDADVSNASNRHMTNNRKFNQVYTAPILDIYLNKRICLLGSGASLNKYDSNFNDYDVVVGINRIYRTKYFSYLDVFYNCLSFQDWDNLEFMISCISQNSKIKETIFVPWRLNRAEKVLLYELCNLYNINYIYTNTITRNIFVTIPEFKKTPLTGVAVLNHILMCSPSSIDLYGFDFYNCGYIENIDYYEDYDSNRFHDIESNTFFFSKLLSENPNIRWYQ